MATNDELTFDQALDRVIGYLGDEHEDYESRPPRERRNHIWRAVEALMRYRGARTFTAADSKRMDAYWAGKDGMDQRVAWLRDGCAAAALLGSEKAAAWLRANQPAVNGEDDDECPF